MKAIEVRFHSVTYKLPCRYVAKDYSGNRAVSSESAPDATLKLARKMGWKGTLVAGGLKSSEVFCFLESDKYEI